MNQNNMRVLVISDVLGDSENGGNNIYVHFCKWNDSLPSINTGFEALVIDLSGIDRDRLLKITPQIEEVSTCLTDDIIDQDNMIVVVVCGTRNYSLIEYEDFDPAERAYDEKEIVKEIPLYQKVFKYMVPYPDRLKDMKQPGNRFKPKAIKYPSILHYLDRMSNYYLYFRYSEDCKDIYPFATTRAGTNACISFERRVGKGVVILLPGYDFDNISDAYLSLIRICRNYYKMREEYDQFIIGLSVPEAIEAYYMEALLCYLNDLYYASRMVGRRTLEEILDKLGITREVPRRKDPNEMRELSLYERFNIVCKMDGVLFKKTQEIGDRIRLAGNEAAHAPEPGSIKRTLFYEEKAREQLKDLKALLLDIDPFAETKQKITSQISQGE